MPAKKIIDDDEVIVKKPKKVVTADDDDVVVKKPKKAAAIADDDAPAAKEAPSTSTAAAAAPVRQSLKLTATTSSASDEWCAPNYDDMSFEQFKALLEAIPMAVAVTQKSTYDNAQAALEAESAKNQIEAFLDGTPGGFQYNDMLSRATTLMRAVGIGETNRSIEIPPPLMERIGSKRIVISNFAAICAAIGRTTIEVQKYFERQTSATTSLDGNEGLILKMKLDGKGVERIFDKFLDEWITCKVCKSIDTTLEKEKSMNRLYKIMCNKCKAFRHQEMTESAYAANTTKRSKLRNAGML